MSIEEPKLDREPVQAEAHSGCVCNACVLGNQAAKSAQVGAHRHATKLREFHLIGVATLLVDLLRARGYSARSLCYGLRSQQQLRMRGLLHTNTESRTLEVSPSDSSAAPLQEAQTQDLRSQNIEAKKRATRSAEHPVTFDV